MCFNLVCAFPLVLGSQILLGLYTGLASSRQWAMLIFAMIVMAVYLLRSRPILYRLIASVTVIFLSVSMYAALKGKHGRLPEKNPYSQISQCALREFPKGSAFVADYWNARPIEMYSGENLKGVPINATGPVFTNASKVAQIRELTPIFVVTGFSVSAPDYMTKFGPPDRVVCSITMPSGSRVELLDYSANETFKADMAAVATAAY